MPNSEINDKSYFNVDTRETNFVANFSLGFSSSGQIVSPGRLGLMAILFDKYDRRWAQMSPLFQ